MSENIILPAEWAPQDGILLAWPHPQSDWLPFLPRIEAVYLDLLTQITRFEQVVMLCHSPELMQHVQAKCIGHGINMQRVHLLVMPYNDTWLRDSGPITVSDGQHTLCCDFRFNGWGGKFDATEDDQICSALSRQSLFAADYKHLSLTLEGGSIDSDGEGTLLTTRQCLLTDTRNPGMTTQDYDALFAEQFGSQHVIWLAHGELQGDDTDGHVDMLARFCDTRTIAYTTCERHDDPHYSSLLQLEHELKALQTRDGQCYRLVALPIPEAIFNAEGQRLPASYANFLIINQAVLVPVYDDPNDAIVLQRLQACFPDREVIGIMARPIIEQYGSLHCLTMQLPTGVLRLS